MSEGLVRQDVKMAEEPAAQGKQTRIMVIADEDVEICCRCRCCWSEDVDYYVIINVRLRYELQANEHSTYGVNHK